MSCTQAKSATDPTEISLLTLGKGEYFGEMALMLEEPRAANCIATGGKVLYHTSCRFFLVHFFCCTLHVFAFLSIPSPKPFITYLIQLMNIKNIPICTFLLFLFSLLLAVAVACLLASVSVRLTDLYACRFASKGVVMSCHVMLCHARREGHVVM